MPRPLVATHRRAGAPVVRIEVAQYWSVEEAARALAVVYHSEPVRRGSPAVQAGLHRAATERVLDAPGVQVDAALAAEYERIIARHRERFVRYCETSSGFRSARWLGRDLSEATHVRTDVAVFYDHEQAARALAAALPDLEVAAAARGDGTEELAARGRRTGRMTCERGLQAAARQQLQARRELNPGVGEDAARRVEFFRRLLVSSGMFPERERS